MATKKNVPADDFEQALAELRTSLQKARTRRKRVRKTIYKYPVSLISYLDILGMRDLLSQAGTDAQKIGEVLEPFQRFSEPERDQKKLWRMSFRNFSDTVVRILPVMTDANIKHRLGCFFHEVSDLCFIQANLISRGWLVRGAMTIDYISAQNGLLFGPGLAKAYHLESEVAQFPRIIISDVAMQALREAPVLRAMGNSFKEEMKYLTFIRKDRDGQWFIDYLDLMRTDSDSPQQYAEFLRLHKELIEKQRLEVGALPKGKLRRGRLAKLKWLIAFHREHISNTPPEKFVEMTGRNIRDLRVKRWKKPL